MDKKENHIQQDDKKKMDLLSCILDLAHIYVKKNTYKIALRL